jgi:hypothetical protein
MSPKEFFDISAQESGHPRRYFYVGQVPSCHPIANRARAALRPMGYVCFGEKRRINRAGLRCADVLRCGCFFLKLHVNTSFAVQRLHDSRCWVFDRSTFSNSPGF